MKKKKVHKAVKDFTWKGWHTPCRYHNWKTLASYWWKHVTCKECQVNKK